MGTNIPHRVARRALEKCVPGFGGCHISTYSTASHGYAQIGWKADDKLKATTAHRAAWTAVNGPIPDGTTVDHTCKNRRCVNPRHLRLLSNFENARRTRGRDWPLGFCIHGHTNSELFHDGSKWRCRPCTRLQQEKYRARKRAKRMGDES